MMMKRRRRKFRKLCRFPQNYFPSFGCDIKISLRVEKKELFTLQKIKEEKTFLLMTPESHFKYRNE
jgi:hypothetical protein